MSTGNSTVRSSSVKDITGKPFGDLTAISYAGTNLGSQAGAYWLCRCKCGVEKVLSGHAIRSGNVKSCGCSKNRTNEVGNVYTKLTVIEFAEKTKSGDSRWLCRCECGNTTIVARGELRKGSTLSCGCHRASAGGGHDTTEYSSWSSMKQRCYNPNNEYYHRYGDRSIHICQQWRNSFVNFLEDMGKKPSAEYSVERINNDGNYSCGHCEECVANGWTANCKWATTMEQGQNTSKTRFLTYNGETYSLREWARRLGINHSTLRDRIAKGWPPEKVFSSEHYFVPPPIKKAKNK